MPAKKTSRSRAGNMELRFVRRLPVSADVVQDSCTAAQASNTGKLLRGRWVVSIAWEWKDADGKAAPVLGLPHGRETFVVESSRKPSEAKRLAELHRRLLEHPAFRKV